MHFEKWLYFLKRLPTFDDIPAILNEKIFVKAFEVAELANLTVEQRLIYESSLKTYRDNINVIETARIEGREEERMEVAKKLLPLGTSLETIQQVTGFSKKEIQDCFNSLENVIL